VDEVALGGVDDVVDDALGERRDPVREQLGVLRGEPLADQQLEAMVLRRTHRQHHLALRGQAHLVALREYHATGG
jgi:hypothetical protein